MDDEELKEKFHELTLMLERIHSDYEMLISPSVDSRHR